MFLGLYGETCWAFTCPLESASGLICAERRWRFGASSRVGCLWHRMAGREPCEVGQPQGEGLWLQSCSPTCTVHRVSSLNITRARARVSCSEAHYKLLLLLKCNPVSDSPPPQLSSSGPGHVWLYGESRTFSLSLWSGTPDQAVPVPTA